MNRLIKKGHLSWRSQKYSKARHCFEKAVHKVFLSHQEKACAQYMLAYLHIEFAEQTHDAMSALGVDLRKPYYDPYFEAGICLTSITEPDFDAERYQLPLIDGHNLLQIGFDYPAAAIWILNNKFMCKRLTTTQFYTLKDIAKQVLTENQAHLEQADWQIPPQALSGAGSKNIYATI